MKLLSMALFACTLSAHATTFMQRPFPEAVQEAPIILRGKTGMSYADWVKIPPNQKRLNTFTQLEVSESIKGSVTARNIVMRELGGEKDGLAMQVFGTAQFKLGEDVVAFLGEPNPDGSCEIQGMMMGKYNIVRDGNGENDGVEYLTGPGITGEQDGHVEHDHASRPGDNHEIKRWSLNDLRQLVASQAAPSSRQKTEPNQKLPQPPQSDNDRTPKAAPTLQPAQPGDDGALAPKESRQWRNLSVAVVILVLAGGVWLKRRPRA